MKKLCGFGLLGCLAVSACASSQAPAASPSEAFAAGHCQGPVTITRQADVGSVGRLCKVIDGDLRIVGTTLTTLDGLGGVQSVHHLVIRNNPRLTSITGLRAVHASTGVTLMDNPLLAGVRGNAGTTLSEREQVGSRSGT